MRDIKSKFNIILFLQVFTGTVLSQNTVHFQSGNSLRNNQLGHYYKMVTWDDSRYQEFSYWVTNTSGSVVEFLNWRAIFPPGYQEAGTTKYPMIIMLHGAGESGREWGGHFAYTPDDPRYDNNSHNLLWGGMEHRDAVNRSSSDSRSFPGIVIFPQVSYSGTWSTVDWNNGALNSNGRMASLIIEHMISQYHADPNRVYVHGLSGGAKGVWDIAAKRPDLFAAMLPMSGVGSDMQIMADILVTTPLWLFQGGLDTNPSPGYSSQWINALKNKGGSPRYTIYPNLDHGTWNTAYAEPDFFSWMLTQDKRKIYVFSDNTSLENQSSIKLGFSAGFLSYQWLRDGSPIAGATSRFYNVTEPGRYSVRFQRKTDGSLDESFPTQITGGDNAFTGLTFNYYEYSGNFPGLGSYDFSQTPTVTGNINNFYLYNKRSEQFALSFEGDVQVDQPGPHRFYTRSANGSQLYVNNVLVVNNDGVHDLRTVSGTYTFPAPGKYDIRVLYFNQSGSPVLNVSYNEGTFDNFSVANMFPDNKLFLPDGGASANSSMASAAPSSAYRTRADSDWYDYYKDQIAYDTTEVTILAYPNPFQERLYISFLREMGVQPVALYSLSTGELLTHKWVDTAETLTMLELNDAPVGLYVLQVGNSRFRILKGTR
jgi:predicted peptidase